MQVFSEILFFEFAVMRLGFKIHNFYEANKLLSGSAVVTGLLHGTLKVIMENLFRMVRYAVFFH